MFFNAQFCTIIAHEFIFHLSLFFAYLTLTKWVLAFGGIEIDIARAAKGLESDYESFDRFVRNPNLDDAEIVSRLF